MIRRLLYSNTLVSLLFTRLHINNVLLLPELQSAYRKHHSTETAVLKIMSDILQAAYSGNVTLLGLLDMSAAFDTVDQPCHPS